MTTKVRAPKVDADTPITNNGRELALQIAPAIKDTTEHTQAICSEICRLARSHHRLAEHACNGYQTWDGEWDEKAEQRAEAKSDRIEARIVLLAEMLPRWREGRRSGTFGATFQGDPRGCTVKLTGPRSRYDSWGGEGVCVPTR